MRQFKILSFIPANGYPVALDVIEAFKELDQFIVTIDLRRIKRGSIPQSAKEVVDRVKPDFIFTTNRVGLIPDLFDEMKIPYVSWWTIDPLELLPPPSRYYFLFTIDNSRLDEHKKRGYRNAYYLPFGTNPRVFKKIKLSSEDLKGMNAISLLPGPMILVWDIGNTKTTLKGYLVRT